MEALVDLDKIIRYQMRVLHTNYKLSPKEIGEMTLSQIRTLTFCPKDEYGQVLRGFALIDKGTTLEDQLKFFRNLQGWDETSDHCKNVVKKLYQKYGVEWQEQQN